MKNLEFIQTNKLKLVIATGVLSMAYLLVSAIPASAAYSGGRLIDDPVFRDSDSMSISQIQSFLESLNSGLKSKKYELQCYDSGSKEREWYTAAGATCDKALPASEVIYYGAKIYGVNPRVILATLQKEQSLITTTNPTERQLKFAMGYGCPTTGNCSDSDFSKQIDSGTWVLRYHYERANGNMTWWNSSTSWVCGTKKAFYKPNLYPGQNVTFIDEDGVSYRTHKLSNPATSSFYCYTPHAYNNPEGLYGLPKYGTKGRYYTGSYNFVYWFEKWFGSTRASIKDQTIIGNWTGAGDRIGIKRGAKYMFDTDNDGVAEISFSIGRSTDQVFVGDWDGDGRDDIGLKRGNNYYLDTDRDNRADHYIGIGRDSDKVIVGDWDGDGKDNIGLKRGNKYYLDVNSSDNTAEIYIGIGRDSDKVIVGDWDGDGKDNIGLKRGNKYYLDVNSSDNTAEIYIGIGRDSDKVIVGDWDGDGKDNIGLKRGSQYYFDTDFDRLADIYVGLGRDSDRVITGDWNNDGKHDFGLERFNRFYFDESLNGTVDTYFIFGFF